MNPQSEMDPMNEKPITHQKEESFPISSPSKKQSNITEGIKSPPIRLTPNSIFAFHEDDNFSEYFTNDFGFNSSTKSINNQIKPEVRDSSVINQYRDTKQTSNPGKEINLSAIYNFPSNRETILSTYSNQEHLIQNCMDRLSSFSLPNDPNPCNRSFNSHASTQYRHSFNMQPEVSFNENPMMNSFFTYPSKQINAYEQMKEKYLFDNLPMLLLEKNRCLSIEERIKENRFNMEWVNLFFKRIEGNIVDLILNQFANYAIQILIDVAIIQGNTFIIERFFELIQNDLYTISIHKFGTIVIQKILEDFLRSNGYTNYFQSDSINKIFETFLITHMLELSNHKCGNHVFQKFIYIFPRDKNQKIYTKANEYAFYISKLPQGACIMQSLILNASFEQKDALISAILIHLPALIIDENANYTLQYIVDASDKKHKKIIYSYIKENLASFVKQKVASNVVDKCITCTTDAYDYPRDLIRYMIKKKMMKDLIYDLYGNYIVQNALKYSKGAEFNEIINQIKQSIKILQKSTLGKQIYENLKLKYPKVFI